MADDTADNTTDTGGGSSLEKQIKDMSDHLVNVRLDIRELTTEVRSLKALQEQVASHETKIIQNEAKSEAAHKRLDKHDKIIWWFATSVGGSVILAVMSLVLINNK